MTSDSLSSPNDSTSGKWSASLTPEKTRTMAACLMAGCTRKETAAALRISERTASRWRKDPRVLAEIERLRNGASDMEIRCWRDGVIPDVAEAVDSPQRLSDDADRARHLLELVPRVPTPVWGRDELHAGEMWNSNSLISWLITRSSLDIGSVRLPRGGRAPGWHAGILVANRQRATAEPTATSGQE